MCWSWRRRVFRPPTSRGRYNISPRVPPRLTQHNERELPMTEDEGHARGKSKYKNRASARLSQFRWDGYVACTGAAVLAGGGHFRGTVVRLRLHRQPKPALHAKPRPLRKGPLQVYLQDHQRRQLRLPWEGALSFGTALSVLTPAELQVLLVIIQISDAENVQWLWNAYNTQVTTD